MNTLHEDKPDITIGRIAQITLGSAIPPRPPTVSRNTRWPVPKPVFTVSYVSRAGDPDDYILVAANSCVRDSVNPREVLADGVVINVGGRITGISK